MKEKYESKKHEIIIIIVCLCVLAPLLIISIYNRPSADDYDYALLTHKVIQNSGSIFDLLAAAWNTTIKFYNLWQGLYISAFILSLQPGIFGVEYYSLTALIVMGISYLLLFMSISIINKYFIKRSKLFVFTATLVVLTVISMWLPSATQGLYWYNGAMNYMPFIFLSLLNICIVLDIYYSEKKSKKVIILILCTLLSFVISGGNHVTAFFNILLLLITTIFLIYKKRYYSLFPLFSSIVGFIIVYVAPGTSIRQNALSKQTLIGTIVATIKHLREIFGDWINIIWILSLILLIPISIEIAFKNKQKFSKKFPFIPIILSMVLISGMFCVPYYPMGNFGDGRVTNVIWIAFMFLSWFIYILIWGYLISNDYINVKKISILFSKFNLKTITVIVAIIMIFIIKINGVNSNSLKSIIELKNGVAESYSKEMDIRFDKYNDDTLLKVTVSPLKIKSEILFFADIGPDPKVWPNTSISEYYGKEIWISYEKSNK